MTRIAMSGTLLLALAFTATADEKKAAPTSLEGSWKVVAAQVEGMPESKEKLANLSFTFEGSKLTVAEGDRKPDAGTFSVNAKADPAQIDMVSPKGDKVSGIYKLDKDGKLTIAFNKGKDTTRPKSFDSKDAIVLVLEKAKK